MQLAFKNQTTGQYIKYPRSTAGHWNELEYTHNINDAWLYAEDYFTRPAGPGKKPYLQDEIQRWKERHGEVIIPVVTTIKEVGEY